MNTAEKGAIRQIRQELESNGGGGGTASTAPTNAELSRSVSALSSMIKGITKGKKPDDYNSDSTLDLEGAEDLTPNERKRAAQ